MEHERVVFESQTGEKHTISLFYKPGPDGSITGKDADGRIIYFSKNPLTANEFMQTRNWKLMSCAPLHPIAWNTKYLFE